MRLMTEISPQTSGETWREGPCLPAGASCWQRFRYGFDELGRLDLAKRWDLKGTERTGHDDADESVPARAADVELRNTYDSGGARVIKTAVDSAGNESHTVYINSSYGLRRTWWSDGDFVQTPDTVTVYVSGGGVRGRVVYSEKDFLAKLTLRSGWRTSERASCGVDGRLYGRRGAPQAPRNSAVNRWSILCFAALLLGCATPLPPCSLKGGMDWQRVQEGMLDFTRGPAAGDRISVFWLDSLDPASNVAVRLNASPDGSQTTATLRRPMGCIGRSGCSRFVLSEGEANLQPSAFAHISSCLDAIGFWSMPEEVREGPFFDGGLVVVAALVNKHRHEVRRPNVARNAEFLACARTALPLIVQ